MSDTLKDTQRFERLQTAAREGDVTGLLETMIQQLRETGRYHELFEALKMRVRQQLALPLLQTDALADNATDALDLETRDRLEDGLLDACREVGTLLLQQGKVAEGWMYLRPLGDKAAAAALLRKLEVTEHNLDEVVQVALHEGVDVELGFRCVLEHYGTCNSITMFESVMRDRPRVQQQQAAGLLVQHLHRELRENVQADIARQEEQTPGSEQLAELVADRPWLFAEHAFHVDTTHLASVVRFARLLDDPATLQLAWDLTQYGRRLSSQFQFPGDEPFAELYPSHELYFDALLGRRVDEALEYFHRRIEEVDEHRYGSVAKEVYIDLLARVGRESAALDEALRLCGEAPPPGFLSTALELARRSGRYEPLLDYFRQHDQLLGFGATLALMKGST